MKRLVTALLALLALTSTAARADDFGLFPALELGQIASGGSGCPGGNTVRAAYDSVTGAVNVQFLSFRPEATSRDPGLKRQSCNLALPMTPPAGYAVQIVDVAMPISTLLEQGTTSQAHLEAFLAGSTGPQDSQNFESPSGTVIKRTALGGHVGTTSGCGESVNVRLNASSQASNSADPTAYAAIAIRSAQLHLSFIPCSP